MKKITFHKISSFSKANFEFLAKRIAQQLALLETVRSALPDDLTGHAVHCVSRANILIIYTDSPAWAAKLRFYQEPVLTVLNNKAKSNFNQFRIKVLKHYSAKPVKQHPTIPSRTVINEIKATSRSVEDRELKQALAKLSATLSRAKAER